MFTGTYELRDVTGGVVVQPERLETDLIRFAGQARHTYRVTSTGQPALVVPGVNYHLVAQHSGKRADINGASTAVGATLVQWPATTGLNQQFDFLPSGDHYRIRVRHSGLVLQVAGTATGADITQQRDAGTSNQLWRLVDHGGGVVSVVNQQSGLAMDVWSASTADGARISQWTATGSTNQRFLLQRA